MTTLSIVYLLVNYFIIYLASSFVDKKNKISYKDILLKSLVLSNIVSVIYLSTIFSLDLKSLTKYCYLLFIVSFLLNIIYFYNLEKKRINKILINTFLNKVEQVPDAAIVVTYYQGTQQPAPPGSSLSH